MNRLSNFLPALVLSIAGASFTFASGPGHADTIAAALRASEQIPLAPAGVTDLALNDIYVMPVGPRGLELTPRAAALQGQRVRLFGFMVRQTKPASGVAMLAPYPLVTNEIEYSLSDDIPANTVFVVVPQFDDIAVPYTPGPLLLTGRFETTPREESDGRVSHLRLVLDEDAGLAPVEPTPEASAVENTSASPADGVALASAPASLPPPAPQTSTAVAQPMP
jgi:hypothetical protein